MTSKPTRITIWDDQIEERNDLEAEGWSWEEMDRGGLLKIRHDRGNYVKIYKE
jgi:hypothetical protein